MYGNITLTTSEPFTARMTPGYNPGVQVLFCQDNIWNVKYGMFLCPDCALRPPEHRVLRLEVAGDSWSDLGHHDIVQREEGGQEMRDRREKEERWGPGGSSY